MLIRGNICGKFSNWTRIFGHKHRLEQIKLWMCQCSIILLHFWPLTLPNSNPSLTLITSLVLISSWTLTASLSKTPLFEDFAHWLLHLYNCHHSQWHMTFTRTTHPGLSGLGPTNSSKLSFHPTQPATAMVIASSLSSPVTASLWKLTHWATSQIPRPRFPARVFHCYNSLTPWHI